MADYDSDSSGGEEVETNVLLGYASKEPTGDDFSQLGGHPFWIEESTKPSGALAKCKTCNGFLNLLLQLNTDLPERFSGHERRIYILACKRKACRRKDGSVRGFRATRQTSVNNVGETAEKQSKPEAPKPAQPPINLGETLFGVKPATSNQANPFATSSNTNGSASNPFATASSLAAKPPQRVEPTETLAQTFAQKAKISLPETIPPAITPVPYVEWPEQAAFPEPYPKYYLDADKEYIEPESQSTPSGVRVGSSSMESESSSAAEDKTAFESTMDKTFQKFADRLSQNPEQVLRYEFAGHPVLYSKTDAVGKSLAPAQENASAKVKTKSSSAGGSRMPRCTNCGAERVFELQLTPQLITELEVDEMSVDGMDWGTIILGVCGRDCMEKGKGDGQVGYLEEWIGVQWEEIASNSGGGGGGGKRS